MYLTLRCDFLFSNYSLFVNFIHFFSYYFNATTKYFAKLCKPLINIASPQTIICNIWANPRQWSTFFLTSCLSLQIVFALCLVALSAGERRFVRQAPFGQPQPQAFQQQQQQRASRQNQPPQQPLPEERAAREYSQQPQQNQLLRQETTTWIPILKYNKEQGNDGSYKTQYETGNNIVAEETGYLKDFNENTPNGVLVQHGSYSYTAPDGQVRKQW